VQQTDATAVVSEYKFTTDKKACNSQTGICVNWDKASEAETKNRGRAVAFRSNEMHYAEVKTEGSVSNTSVIIIHDDAFASEFIGTGEATSNIVFIKQNSGVLRR
jgi:hypothetical protein